MTSAPHTPSQAPPLALRLEDNVGYLLSRARLKLVKCVDIAFSEFGITSAQAGIVVMLASGQYSTAAELARDLYIDSAAMTRMLDRLERRGLIARSRQSADRRVVSLTLTAEGARLGGRLPESYKDVVHRNFADLSGDEIETLKALLRKSLGSEWAPGVHLRQHAPTASATPKTSQT